MEEIEKKVDEQMKLVTDIREKFEKAEEGKFTKAEAKEFEEKVNKKYDEIQAKIDELMNALKERIETVETKIKRPGNAPDDKDEKSLEEKAFNKWLRFGGGVLTAEEQKSMRARREEPIKAELLRQFDIPEEKVLTIAGTSGITYLAPGTYENTIIKGVVEISPMRQLADIKPTSGNFSEIPKRTGTLSGGWTAETGTKVEDTGLTYGMETIPNHEMYALVKVSNHSLEDSAFNLEAEITAEIMETFGKLEGVGFVTGNAVTQPEGFTVNASVGASTVVFDVSDDKIALNGVLDLLFAPKTAYARNGTIVCNRTTIAYLRKYSDATSGLYYWQPDGQRGTPGIFNGYPIVEMPDMANLTTAGYKGMAFGDFKRGYVISDRMGISIQRLVELYAESNCVGFLARRRVGGQVVLPEAIYIGISQS